MAVLVERGTGEDGLSCHIFFVGSGNGNGIVSSFAGVTSCSVVGLAAAQAFEVYADPCWIFNLSFGLA